MKAKSENLMDADAMMDAEFGKVGTQEREEFRREAYTYCIGKLIHEARKKAGITQFELAERMGTNKSYISGIEKGMIDPGVGMFYRIIEALGLEVEIVKSTI